MTAVFGSARKNSKTRFCYEAVYGHRPAGETVAMLEHVRKFMAPTRRFARAEDAAAAVEFALVAAPLALIFAILETALVFFAGQTPEAAASNSARLIMTGQAQMAGRRCATA